MTAVVVHTLLINPAKSLKPTQGFSLASAKPTHQHTPDATRTPHTRDPSRIDHLLSSTHRGRCRTSHLSTRGSSIKMATDLSDATLSLSLSNAPGPDDLSPLEQDVLEEYERLADNMKKVRPISFISFHALPFPTSHCSLNCTTLLTHTDCNPSSHLSSTAWQARRRLRSSMACCS